MAKEQGDGISFFNPAYWCVVRADKESNEITAYISPVLVQRGPLEYWSNFSRRIIGEIQEYPYEWCGVAYKKDFPLTRVGVMTFAKDRKALRAPNPRNVKAIYDFINYAKDRPEPATPEERTIIPPQQGMPMEWETTHEGNVTIVTPTKWQKLGISEHTAIHA